jgi:hypothetical protein
MAANQTKQQIPNKRFKMFDTAELAGLWFDIFNGVLLLGAFLVLLGTWGTIKTGAIKEKFSDERVAANEAETKRAVADSDAAKEGTAKANERIAELSTQAEQLRKDTAEANAQALEAQVALEKFKAPRAISVEQRNRIVEQMKQFAGQQYFGMVASDIADAWDIWREIGLSLELAGWNRLPPPGQTAKQYGPPAGIALAPQAGVMVLSSIQNAPSENMRLYRVAQALAAKLTDESIIAGAGFADLQPDTIAIVIGPKP